MGGGMAEGGVKGWSSRVGGKEFKDDESSSLNSLRKCPPPPPRILNFGQQDSNLAGN
jgi:hypothetical protein